MSWAAAEAALLGVALRLVHGFSALPYESGPAAHELLRCAAQSELDDAVRLARRDWPELPVSSQLSPHRPDLALQEQSTNATAVVIGTRAYAVELVEARFGSAVGTLLGSAGCPVVAVPQAPRRSERPGTVVVAVDGSPVSQPAVAFAFEAAQRRRAPLTMVHCWPAQRSAAGRAAARQRHQSLLAEMLAGTAQRYPEVHVTDRGHEGDPAAELVRWSKQAALLVVGTHGRDRWATAVWGSVSRVLVRESACPVAVVPACARQREQG